MATNNTRVVGYLPPDYHGKLREYMKVQSLSESAALVKIIKQFFDGTELNHSGGNSKQQDDAIPQEGQGFAIAELKADVAQLHKRLGVLESAIVSGSRLNKASTRTSHQYGPPPVLPPQTSSQLARRLGVSAATVEEAEQQGEAYFTNWSKRMDPSKRSWCKRGELFHPLAD